MNNPETQPAEKPQINVERPAQDFNVIDAPPAEPDLKKDIEITHIIYGLMAAGYVTGGIGSLSAIILNYIKLEEVKGTWLEGHFRWQIRTFWWSLLWGVLGLILSMVVVGIFGLIALVIWNIYRIAKGWLRLNDGKAME